MKTLTIIKPIEVLLVESDSKYINKFRKNLNQVSSTQFSLTCSRDIAEAVRHIEKKEYDIIMLDPALPESQGFETFISIRMHAPKVPIILLLGVHDEDLAVKALQNGAQDCLIKGDMDGIQLRRAIRFAIERHRIMAELEQARQREHRLAYFDALTDLPNRQLFYDRLDRALSHANRYKEKVALMFIDLDCFKPVNDSMGHNIGDILLQIVAERLKDCLRKSDTVARIGGDEFTCILPHIEKTRDIVVVAKKIKKALATPFELNGYNVSISGSIGISVFPEDTGDLHDLVKNADMAMYHAKKQGRNNFQFFNKDLNSIIPARLSKKSTLNFVTDRGEFLYQDGMENRRPAKKAKSLSL